MKSIIEKKKTYKRAFRAVLHRRKGNSTEEIFTRYYETVTSALTRGVNYAILRGEPGDVLEITSSNFEYEIATLKIKVGSKGLSSMDIKFHIFTDLELERLRQQEKDLINFKG